LKYAFIFLKSKIMHLKYKTTKYAKICILKIALFYSVEHESRLAINWINRKKYAIS